MRAIFIVLGHLFGSSQAQNEEKVLYGLAASKGVYEGPARRVSSPSEFGRIAKGDVLVTESTTEAFNILLPLLGGIVTDNGGLLSHAAIVSREYGIPGVGGTREATERIADGVRVRVDGDPARSRCLRKVTVPNARRSSGSKAVGSACRRQGPPVHRISGDGAGRRAGEEGHEKVAMLIRTCAPFPSVVVGEPARRQFRRLHYCPQRPFVGGSPARPRSLVVGELGLGHHLPPTRRPVHPTERRRRRPDAPQSRRRRGHVHREPGHRRR
jgi:phosphohistidine swiveling domain-containing protein